MNEQTIDRRMHTQNKEKAHRGFARQAHERTQSDRETDRQIDRRTDRHVSRHRQRDRETNR